MTQCAYLICLFLIMTTSFSPVHGEARYDNPVDHRSYITEGEFN